MSQIAVLETGTFGVGRLLRRTACPAEPAMFECLAPFNQCRQVQRVEPAVTVMLAILVSVLRTRGGWWHGP